MKFKRLFPTLLAIIVLLLLWQITSMLIAYPDIFPGVLGQKYGVKNGPPYPLDEGDHSSSEESAAKKAGISVGTSSGEGSLDNVEPRHFKRNANGNRYMRKNGRDVKILSGFFGKKTKIRM